MSPATETRGLRVLLVDDEPSVRKYMKVILVQHGCDVVEAENGSDAFRAVQQAAGNFDLLVTDVRMPGMDGLSLADHVHRDYPAIQVLFVSAYVSNPPVAPHFPLLRKPFPPQALITRVRELSGQQ